MTKFVVSRLFKAVITVWFIVSLVFVCTRMSGDPTLWILPDDAPEAARIELRESLGLDRPVTAQYVSYFADALRGDMGCSYKYLRPVNEVFAESAWATVSLGVLAFSLAILLGVLLGVMAAVHRNSPLDRITMSVFGILLIFLFSLKLRMLPSGGNSTAAHYIMPTLTLMMGPMANIARLTRSSMLDVLRQDYLECARSKGVPEIVVIFKHSLRNALIPVVTIIGLQMGIIIGGSVVVETVFAWPGIGSLIVNAELRVSRSPHPRQLLRRRTA